MGRLCRSHRNTPPSLPGHRVGFRASCFSMSWHPLLNLILLVPKADYFIFNFPCLTFKNHDTVVLPFVEVHKKNTPPRKINRIYPGSLGRDWKEMVAAFRQKPRAWPSAQRPLCSGRSSATGTGARSLPSQFTQLPGPLRCEGHTSRTAGFSLRVSPLVSTCVNTGISLLAN